jgi:crotonobetaine/carnitine-CoA ligase
MTGSALEGSAVERTILLDGGDVPNSVAYASLRDAQPSKHPVDVGPPDVAAILYTSGTTGLPKGCMLSHGYFCAGGAAAGDADWVIPGDRMFVGFPHFHTSFLLNSLMSALMIGASIVHEPDFHASTFMRRAQEDSATMIWGLGTMAMAILSRPPAADDRIESLRLSAWVPLHPDRQREFEERFGGIVNCEAYGQTEANPIVITAPNDPLRDPSTAGRASVLYDVRIVDDEDEEVPAGVVGEIVVRSKRPYTMFAGYWGKPDVSLRTFRNLWHHTGDLGRLDEDGRLTFVDRAKDALRRRGENVSCFEIELAIAQHPKILQAAASAVPSPLGEDDIKISVICHGADAITPEEVFEFCRSNLPYYAIPRYVEQRESFPLTATGRVRKDVLRAEGVHEGLWDFEKLGFTVERHERRS